MSPLEKTGRTVGAVVLSVEAGTVATARSSRSDSGISFEATPKCSCSSFSGPSTDR